jgi:redox-sensitive bicupin YhaK (pirin superfamily)
MRLLIEPRVQHIGFDVKRILPSRFKQRVGPFIFIDHMGPASFKAGTTEGDVRQHPHIGLATVTYLFSGAIQHRDSLGVTQLIEPGAINLMTAGKGIVHSERIPQDLRSTGAPLEGLQTWLALPTEREEDEPDFAHYPQAVIPHIEQPGLSARVLIGTAFGVTSPVVTASKTTYVAIELDADQDYKIDISQQELAIYLAEGEVTVNGEPLATYHLSIVEEGDIIHASCDARIMLLGGEPLAGDRFIFWNFVSSHKEKLREAGERWEAGKFTMVPGETDFIPLPK